jgi:hypothetical protein
MENEDDRLIPQPQYGMPDEASLELTKLYIEDKPFIYDPEHPKDEEHVIEGDVPPAMKNFFWGFFSKDNVLSVTTQKEVELAMFRFKAQRKIFRMSIPRHKFTYKTMRQLDNLENQFKLKIMRSLYGFERKQQNTQMQAQLYGSMDDNQNHGRRRSIFNPLGLFTGGQR